MTGEINLAENVHLEAIARWRRKDFGATTSDQSNVFPPPVLSLYPVKDMSVFSKAARIEQGW